MTELVLMKAGAGMLVAADQQSADQIDKLKLGAGAKVTIKRVRNLGHHRKMFALLNLAFDAWEPKSLEYKGQPVAKNFDSFRSDLIILAGYGEATYNFRGEIRVRAKSISFSSMDQGEFDDLYESVITVILHKILRNYTRSDIDNVIQKLIGFI